MSVFLRQSTSIDVRLGPFVDVGDGFTPETGVTIGASDEAEILKADGAGTVAMTGTLAAVTDCDGWYDYTIQTGDVDTVGELVIVMQDLSVYLPVFMRFYVVEEAVYDALYVASAEGPLQGTTAGNTLDVTAAGEAGLDLDNVSGALGTTEFDADFLTAALIADNALVAANFAAGAFDAVWSVAARILTANTNFNDPTAATIADAVWDEDIEAAHGGDAAAGLLLRALGAGISNRAQNATLNALLGVADSAGVDLVDEILDGHTMAELAQQLPPAVPTLREAVMLLMMGYRDETITSASLHSIKNDAGTVVAKQVVADASGTLTRSKMTSGP